MPVLFAEDLDVTSFAWRRELRAKVVRILRAKRLACV